MLHHLPTMNNIAPRRLILRRILLTNIHAYQWHVTSYLIIIIFH